MRNCAGHSFAKLLLMVGCCAVVCPTSSAKDKDKPKPSGSHVVDSGTFGVFNSGARVATETFTVEQSATGSVIASQFKSAQGEQVAEQSSELQLAPSAELRKYEWKETSPEKITATVVPDEAFLIEHFTNGSDNKVHDQNFLLSASTAILDDYFFVQREVLAWRYLASACKVNNSAPSCPMHQKVQFGSLNPHARNSMSVGIEYAGRDKVNLHGKERELSRFLMTSEAGDWSLWFDDQLKLVRLLSDGGMEVVRD